MSSGYSESIIEAWIGCSADISIAPFPHLSDSEKHSFNNDILDHPLKHHEWSDHLVGDENHQGTISILHARLSI